MEENIEMKDIRLLISRLMSFIVLDGKHFVNETEKENYVKSYLHLFVKMINDPVTDENAKKAVVIEQIFKDISKYIN